MKKIYLNLFGIGLAFTTCFNVSAETLSGEGTEDSPYLISSYEDLKLISEDMTAVYKLTSDIDASASKTENEGAGWATIGSSTDRFYGTIYGDGFSISNLYINSTESDNVGFLGFISGATIESLSFADADVTGGNYTGVLAGHIHASYVTDCHTTGSVKGVMYVGVFCGNLNAATIANSSSEGTVVFSGSVGGGFTGANNYSSTMTGCYSKGSIVSDSEGSMIGGLAGMSGTSCSFIDCYSTVDITGGDVVGGIAGSVIGSTIINSYYAGKIESTGSKVGGVAGNTMSGAAGSMVPPITATSIYWDSEVAGVTESNIGTAKTTSDLHTKSTFEDWDFDDIWSMPEDGYPVLAWEETRNTAAIETSVYEECKVYPATEGITVVSESEITGITVYTLTGALANSTKPYASSVTIGLPKGYYIVKVITTTGEFVSKTVVY